MYLKTGIWVILSGLLLFSVAAARAQAGEAEPLDMKHLQVTNLSLASGVVSWVTDEKTITSWVEVRPAGTDSVGKFFDDFRDSSYVHYVILIGLKPATEYQYRLGSGEASWDNGGAWYTFKTLPSAYPVPPLTMFGRVTDTGENKLSRVLVRIRIERDGQAPSLARSLLTNRDGAWTTTYSDFYDSAGHLYGGGPGDRLLIDYIPNYWSQQSDSSHVLQGNSPEPLGTAKIFVYDPHEVKRGDLDSNGLINIFDLLEMLKVLAGGQVPAEPRLAAAADLDTNGTINIMDLLALLQVLSLGAQVA